MVLLLVVAAVVVATIDDRFLSTAKPIPLGSGS
jgi:hypothetical protein